MKYLVTGGAGFIGSQLCDALIEQGNDVTIIDNLIFGKTDNIRANAKFLKGDIRDRKLIEQTIQKVDFCYHLAALSSVKQSIDNWTESNSVNLGGTVNIFESAAKYGVPVVYASSAAVYGESIKDYGSESDIVQPLSPYAFDKYSSEIQAKLFGRIKNLKTLGLRFFNVYGPRQNPNSPYSGVISVFCHKAINDQALNIYGSGNQVRDFVFIQDVINALILSIKFVSSEAQVYNICSGNETSINNLAHIILNKLNKNLPIEYSLPQTADIKRSVGSIKKSLSDMGFQTKVPLTEGITYLLRAL